MFKFADKDCFARSQVLCRSGNLEQLDKNEQLGNRSKVLRSEESRFKLTAKDYDSSNFRSI